MLKLFNCIFLFLGINSINVDNFTDMKIIFDDYNDEKKNNKIFYKIFISFILLIKPIYFLYKIIQNNNKIFCRLCFI